MKTCHKHNHWPCGAGLVMSIMDAIADGRDLSVFDRDTMQLLSEGRAPDAA